MFLLGAFHPGDGVEEQLIVVTRGEPAQFVAGPVQQYRAQVADFAGDPVGRGRVVGVPLPGIGCGI